MIPSDSLTETDTELKTLRSYHADGHIELIVGSGLIFLTICKLLHFHPVMIAVNIWSVVLLCFVWNEWILTRRVGHVKFHPDLIKQEITRYVYITATAIIASIAVGFLVYQWNMQDKFKVLFPTEDADFALFFGSITTFCFIAIAIARNLKRHYVVAIINGVTWGLALWGIIKPFSIFLILGLTLALPGAWLMRRYFADHPKLPKPMAEPVNPQAEIEFINNESSERDLVEKIRSDGGMEFYTAFFYVMIGMEFWNMDKVLSLAPALIVAIALTTLWPYVFTRNVMGKENFKRGKLLMRTRYRSSAAMALVFVPFMLVAQIPHMMSKGTPLSFFANADLFFAVWIAASFYVSGKVFKFKRSMLPLVASAPLYLLLHFCHVPRLTNSIIVGSYVFVLGVIQARNLLATRRPRYVEQS